jgi:hypothetical protein
MKPGYLPRISGATTFQDNNSIWKASGPLPSYISKFFDEALQMPTPAPGRFVPISKVDRALSESGLSLADRLQFKAELRSRGFIA